MRLMLRLIALLALVAAVIAGTIDAVASVAAGGIRLTTVAAAWAHLSPQPLSGLRAGLETGPLGTVGAAVVDWLLAQPVVAVLLVAAFVFHCVGYRRRRPARHYALR